MDSLKAGSKIMSSKSKVGLMKALQIVTEDTPAKKR